MDLELLMLSLQFPELDGIPVLYSVKEVSAGEAGSVTVVSLLTLIRDKKEF